MSSYGIPYMGSKSKICEDVCRIFPKADNFYDLFGGGFSISHFMLKHRSSHYKNFHFNEIRIGVCDLIKDAIDGKYSYDNFKPGWISREGFMAEKDSNAYIKLIWSFGNNGVDYLFGKDIEPLKKSIHMAVVFNEFDEYVKRFLGMDKFKEGMSIKDKRKFFNYRAKKIMGNRSELQQLERLEQLHFATGSYSDLEIKPNSIIYCDIPYQGTADYGGRFSHKDFFNWASDQKEPVFISEYNISDSRFKLISTISKRSSLSTGRENTLIKTEKIYVNNAGYRKISRKVF